MDDSHLQHLLDIKSSLSSLDSKIEYMNDSFKQHIEDDKDLAARVGSIEVKVAEANARIAGAAKLLAIITSLVGIAWVLVQAARLHIR